MSYSISTRYQVADPSALIEKAPAIREKAIAAGAEGAALIQPIAAGPHVDVMLALTVWNSVDAGIEGLGKLYADPDIEALRDGNPTLDRSISKLMASYGDIDGQYIGVTRFTASEMSERGVAIAWEKGKAQGITAIRASHCIAGGDNVGSYRAMFFTNSLDAWAQTIAELRADDEYLSEMARVNFEVVFRGIARRF